MTKKELMDELTQLIGTEDKPDEYFGDTVVVWPLSSLYHLNYQDSVKECQLILDRINARFGFDIKVRSECVYNCYVRYEFTEGQHGIQLLLILKA